MGDKLTLLGGPPIRTAGWPTWPPTDSEGEAAVLEAFRSGRWSITTPGNGEEAWEPRLGKAFAEFCLAKYAVPTANGSGAIAIGLAALGIRGGDEVLVPAISWVACAAAVLSLGAIPVPVDIDESTLCMSLKRAEESLTAATSGVLLVHQNCSIADVDGYREFVDDRGLILVEDCSHAHGARFRGKPVGNFGGVGAFSLQQNKLLTCGEGGIAVTNKTDTFRKLQQLRANGREYADLETLDGSLAEVGDQMGDNLVLGEIAAALAYARLQRLDTENERRRRAAKRITQALETIPGISPVRAGGPNREPCFHKFTLRLNLEFFADLPIDVIASAVSAEIGFPVGVLDAPLVDNCLYRPSLSPRIGEAAASSFKKREFPAATAAARSCLAIRHHALLAEDDALDDIPSALAKVQANSSALRNAEIA